MSYESEVLADNPVVLFRMSEASGDLVDVIASKAGTANGSPIYGATGPIPGQTAIDFPGVATDFFSVADHADLDLGDGPFSIEFWLARDVDTGAFELVMDKGSGAYGVSVAASSWPDKMVLAKQGTDILFYSTNVIAADGSWHHWVITRSAAGVGNTVIYRDGVAETSTNNAAPVLADSASSLLIGKEAAGAPLNGKLAYVAIYKSVLSGTRVSAHYAAASGSAVARTAADALALADAVVRIFVGARTTSDTRGQSDVATRAFAGSRTATDSITHSDAATQIKTLLRTAADALGLADAATRAGAFLRTTTDSIARSDAATRTGAFLRTTTDAIARSDVATRAVSAIRTATDTATYADAATRAVAFVRSTADATGLSDAAVAVVTGAVTIGSAVISLVERIAAAFGLTETASASMTLSLTHEAALSVATEYDLNDTASPSVTFTVDGVATDPTTITLTVIPPDKSTATYTYAGGSVTRTSTGVYTKNITLDQRGVWYLRFAGTGACQASAEGTLRVRA